MQEKCDELMGFFSSLMWTPCHTFRETTVSHLIYVARLKLKWILSCCGLKKAEANNITIKEPLSKVVRRWKLIYPCLRSLSGQPGGVGLEEGRDCAGPKALNSATSPEEPRVCARSMRCAQGPSTVCESAESKVLAVNREWSQWPAP